MNAFMRHMGDQFKTLPDIIQQAHQGEIQLKGQITVKRGNWLARRIASLFAMPAAGENVLLQVHGSHLEDRMIWRRRFDEHKMESCFTLKGEYMEERLGPIRLRLKLESHDSRLEYRLKTASLWGIPIPVFIAPRLGACETERNGQYYFHVKVGLPLLGRLIEYYGELQLQNL